MVASGTLSPADSYRAIDHDTILLLFGMMLLSVYLQRAGFFEWLTRHVLSLCTTPLKFLLAVVGVSGGLSALLVNDTVCLFLTPLVVSVCERAGLPLGPFLIALATSANIGSAATLVGNPQNMIIGSLSRMEFVRFSLAAAPAAAAGLMANFGLLWLFYRRKFTARLNRPPADPRRMALRPLALPLGVTLAVFAGFLAGFHMGYTTLTGVTVLILAAREDPRDIFCQVDWPLLIFFSGLFIVIAGLAKTGIVDTAWHLSVDYMRLSEAGGLALFSAAMTIGSNLVSNVPMVLLTGPYLDQLGVGPMGWVLLAYTTTVAGNFTLLGSVANIIVADKARKHYDLSFGEYLRFGVPSTLVVMTVGVIVIYLLST
jgi:Na+/H+ antiporter NhaD/arsenite permease-like protein